ncbi:MAG TPA: SPOR domain-containing protein [Castellaniella sp.]|uniref:SPOR domain-containing protein n=1 Tax=Castellaniella sp. TaxID=1955812 RepID=UPI002F1D6441
MARKKASRKGSTWSGLFLGIVLGVAAAVAVALYVTKAPMPFKDKASRSIPSTLLPDVGHAPDPNIALYGENGPAGTRSAAQGGSTNNPPAPAPEPGQTQSPDAIGQLISGIDNKPGTVPAGKPATIVASAKPALTPPPMPAPTERAEKPASKPASHRASSLPMPPPAPPAPVHRSANTQTTYYLQTGAFRSRDEAEAMLARVVLLGLPVHVEAGQANGSPINRVRVGPFKGIDDMNRARTKLGDDKIESTVVRP